MLIDVGSEDGRLDDVQSLLQGRKIVDSSARLLLCSGKQDVAEGGDQKCPAAAGWVQNSQAAALVFIAIRNCFDEKAVNQIIANVAARWIQPSTISS